MQNGQALQPAAKYPQLVSDTVRQWRQDAQCGTAVDYLPDSRTICEHVGRGQTGRVSLLPRAFWIRKGDVFYSRVELRRLIGIEALLLAGVYILVLFAAVVAALSGNRISVWGWPLLTLPGFAFVPAVADALRLHRTTGLARMTLLWRRCGISAGTGTMLLFAVAAAPGRMT